MGTLPLQVDVWTAEFADVRRIIGEALKLTLIMSASRSQADEIGPTDIFGRKGNRAPTRLDLQGFSQLLRAPQRGRWMPQGLQEGS